MFERLRSRRRTTDSPTSPRHQIEVLSITFELDVRLCQLQLTSFDRFFDLDTLTRFTVVVNGGEPVLAELRRHVETLSPALREKLVLLEPHEMRKGDFNSWRGQQVLKLLFARRVETSHYLVLDAKNHLLRPTSASDWFDEQGRARTHLSPAPDVWCRITDAFAVYGIDRDPTAPAMPTITPFVMQTDVVKELMRDLSARAGVPFVRAFRTRYPRAGEFFLYYSYLLHTHGTIDGHHYDAPSTCVTLFTVWPQDPEVIAEELARLDDPGVLFFGLHRNRLAQLDEAQRDRITQVWRDAGLLDVHPADYYLTPLS